MIDSNNENPTKMWKTLKELIRDEPRNTEDIDNIDFEIVDGINGCNIVDKFNIYYIVLVT